MENELHPPPQGCFRKPFLDSRTLDLDLDLGAMLMKITVLQVKKRILPWTDGGDS